MCESWEGDVASHIIAGRMCACTMKLDGRLLKILGFDVTDFVHCNVNCEPEATHRFQFHYHFVLTMLSGTLTSVPGGHLL
jgi:hypothetical protein